MTPRNKAHYIARLDLATAQLTATIRDLATMAIELRTEKRVDLDRAAAQVDDALSSIAYAGECAADARAYVKRTGTD